MRPNDWTDECGQGHDKPTHVLHMCSPIRLVLPLRTHVALVLNSWAAQFLVLVTDKRWGGFPPSERGIQAGAKRVIVFQLGRVADHAAIADDHVAA